MKTKVTLSILCLAMSAFGQPGTSMMKAIVVHQFGGPDVLKFEETAQPQPKDDEVLIHVMAAGVNPVDGFIRAGRFGQRQLPYIPGMDAAGVVEATGSAVRKFKRGDAVYAYVGREQGAYAEYCVAREGEVSLKPKNLDFEEASAVPLAATTAWQALFDTAKLHPGQTVLIFGASGGVGHFAVQLAKARGAKVIATASTGHQDLLKKLGVDQAIDYSKTRFEDVVKDVDVVLEATRSDSMARSYGIVKKGGFIVTITGEPDRTELEKHGISGSGMGAEPDGHVLDELTKLIEANKVKPIVSQVFPLADASKAHQQIETRHTAGKIVLKVADAPR